MREENNQVKVVGEVTGDFIFSHEVWGERFYTGFLKVPRFSGDSDIIPVMVSDRLIDVTANWSGCYLSIEGQFRSFNRKLPDGRSKLELHVHAVDAEVFSDMDIRSADMNRITLDGYLCKEPVFRVTPLGRQITDLIVAANRSYGKSDYIPCICWGRNAKYAAKFCVGDHCTLTGRIQSRVYHKTLEDGSIEERTAWEVSVQMISIESF